MTTPKTHKRRGAGFETALVDWLRARGYRAERLPLTGTKDEGDVAITTDDGKQAIVIEAKAPGAGGRIDLAAWCREAATEAANYATARGLNPDDVEALVVIKARGKTLDQAYVVKPLGEVLP